MLQKSTFCHKPNFFCSLMVNSVQTWLQPEKLKFEAKKYFCCKVIVAVVFVLF